MQKHAQMLGVSPAELNLASSGGQSSSVKPSSESKTKEEIRVGQ